MVQNYFQLNLVKDLMPINALVYDGRLPSFIELLFYVEHGPLLSWGKISETVKLTPYLFMKNFPILLVL